jgi:branched-chain amino acid transport system permease protein
VLKRKSKHGGEHAKATKPANHRNLIRRRIFFFIALGWFLLLLGDRVDELRVYQGALIAIYALAIGSLILLTGYSGQISLGHGAFMAIGAYAAALTQINFAPPLIVTFIVAVLIAALSGALLGGGASRLSGPYLAGTTLALALGLPTLANQFAFLGGETGLSFDVGFPPERFGLDFTLYKWFFWIAGLATLIMLWVIQNILKSRYGRAWKAGRTNPAAASLVGLNVGRRKVLAFTVSAGVAGLAGALLGMIAIVSPSAFPLSLSFAILTGAVLAGLTSLAGTIIGGLVLVIIPDIAETISYNLGDSEAVVANLPGLITSVLLILAVILTPNGPAEQWHHHKEAKKKKELAKGH